MATVMKKKRTTLRTAATKIMNELRTQKLTEEDEYAKRTGLRKVADDLDAINEKVLDLLIEEEASDEVLEAEMDRSREVSESINSILRKFDKLDDTRSRESGEESYVSADRNAPRTHLKLPKINLEKFDLSPNTFTAFWAQFASIDSNNSLTNVEKFSYLKMTVTGCAKTLLDTYPLSNDNYTKALAHLKDRFGRKDLIVNAIFKELIDLVRGTPSLTKLYDTVSAKIRCLSSFGLSTEQTAILVPLIVECIPYESRRLWERRQVVDNEDKMDTLVKFLRQEAEAEERITSIQKPKKEKEKESHPTTAVFVATPSHSTLRPRTSCIFCNENHANKDCTKVLPVSKRRELVKSNRCCFACLAPGHSINQCKTRERLSCGKCKGKHRELCCTKETPPEEKLKEDKKRNENESNTNRPTASCFAGATAGTTILLQTLPALSKNRKVRVLLDTGSHQSYASTKICEEVGVKVGEVSFKHMLFGGNTSGEISHPIYDIELQSMDGTKVKFNVLQQETICGSIPSNTRNISTRFLEEYDIKLADDHEERPVEVLLGADNIPLIFKGVKAVDKMLAFETTLGWCAMGVHEGQTSSTLLNLLSLPLLPHLWELEPLGIEPPTKANNDEERLEEFNKTVKLDEEGHYAVQLPWIEGHPPINDNRALAQIRLQQVLNRLKRNNLYDAYDDVFKQWQADGIIEEVKPNDENETEHFLPHRPVVREGKTTKIRPVFDASAKDTGEVSLNDCLSAGPNLIADLLKILLRFRMKPVGMIADIKQAFLMIRLSLESDKNMLKFLWERDGKIIVYRHCRVVFGLTCSPFLLNATIGHLLQDETKELSKQLRDSFYVDDSVTSVESTEEADEFQRNAIDLLARAGLDLRGWVRSGDAGTQHVLGIIWMSSEDTIGVRKPEFKTASSYTKKDLLSLVGRIYDPLGLLAAATLPLKLLLKECFRLKLSWDEPIPINIQVPVEKWLTEVNLIDAIMIPRSLKTHEEGTSQLHVFSDASKVALGTCVFLRWETASKVTTTLVTSKARVAPNENLTIPRLELIAALLSARMGRLVSETLKVEDVTFWSDSTCTLYWIKRGEWRTFVGNRVKEIRLLSDSKQWRFVDGYRNPADLFSRGCTISEYSEWNGPTWLKEPPSTWPEDKLIPTTDEAQVITLVTLPESEKDVEMFARIGGFSRAVRVMGWIKRFISNTRGTRNIEERLTVDEVQNAKETLLLWLQKTFTLSTENVDILHDEKGFVRVRTKLLDDQLLGSFKEPILLPNCTLTDYLIKETHEKNHHAGVTIVLGLLREQYWIPKARQVSRKIIRRCVRCRRFNAKPMQTPAVGLPTNRVKMGKAFETSGCDLAGPLYLQNDEKVWIVLFTCAVYRAVHLEIVDSLSTEAFLLALRRMIARRGKVKEMYSDNGTNLVGAWNLISQAKVENDSGIRWIFHAPHAPWWGGFCERLIGVMKSLIRRTLGKARLNDTELNTVLIEVEGLMNSRPITYCSDDPKELQPLTPLMFIQENSNVAVPELDNVDQNHFTRRMRYVQELRSQLKERFRREYLGALLLRSRKCTAPVQLGELVWVMSDEKRINWLLGKVIECYPGKDNVVRAVKIKTATGELMRPVQRLCKMEVHCSEEIEDEKDETVDGVEGDLAIDPNEGSDLVDDLSEIIEPTGDDALVSDLNQPYVPQVVHSRVGRIVKRPSKLDL